MSQSFSTLASTQTPENTQTDPLQTMLAGIKNENGEQKYGSVEKALEALQHSQSFIPELKTQLQQREEEVAALRIDMAKQQGVQETIERLQQSAPQEPTVHQPAVQEPTQDIEALVSTHMQKLEQARQGEANFKQVFDAVQGMYGEKTGDFIAQKSSELGMSPDALDSMAKTSPKAALALLGVGSKTSHNISSVTAGSQRTEITTPREELQRPEKSLLMGATEKDKMAYMQKIRENVYAKYDVQTN